MSSESPFLLIKVECPVCKTINEFEQIKVGAYTEGGRDTDFCPQAVEWRHPKYQAYNPLVFFTGTCSNCYYTREVNNKFRDWKSDNAFRTFQLKNIKTKHLERLSVADSVVRRLGEAINIHRYPDESAIIKLHLAVYDTQVADHPSHLDLARFYIRIGWVFRNMSFSEDPQRALLSGLVKEIETKYTALEAAAAQSQKAVDELAECVQGHFSTEHIPAETQSLMFAFRDRYDAELAAMNQPIGDTVARQQGFKALLDEYRTAVLGGSSPEGTPTFGEHSSLTEFLTSLHSAWTGIVTSEREALEQAVYNYKQAFAGGRDIAAGNQQIQASYLIAELSRRIGDYDGAKQYFTTTIKSGQEFIYENRRDASRTVLARKILELAIEQGRANLEASKAE